MFLSLKSSENFLKKRTLLMKTGSLLMKTGGGLDLACRRGFASLAFSGLLLEFLYTLYMM